MQYSLRTVMLAILALALLLVAPVQTLSLIWTVLPSLLVALWLYGPLNQRTFALGSLVGYVAVALQHGGVQGTGWLELPWRVLVLAVSGCLMVLLRRWSAGGETIADPPRWPQE